MLESIKSALSNPKHYKYISKILWRYFFISIAAVIAFLFFVKIGLFGKMPDIEEIENPKTSLATEIYSEDKVLMGKYYIENRANSTFKDFPNHLVQALIATEDIRFYQHSGIDAQGLARAVVRMGRDGGASTISQQLAKNLFHTKAKSLPERILQKIKEMIIAVELEKRYTKEEIITQYFNTVPFGSNSFGIKSAAKTFFSKSTKKLTTEESALLIGMLKGSTIYNPVRNPERALKRRNIVLGQMYKEGKFITESEFNTLKDLPLNLKITVQNQNEGISPYFRMILQDYLTDWCKSRNLNIYRDGLKIYTTINSKMQKYAENAMQKHMPVLQKEFFAESRGSTPWKDEESPWKSDTNYIWKHLKKTEHYKSLKSVFGDKHKDSMMYYLKQKRRINVFTWAGEKDTTFSTIDSLKYYKSLFHTGFMSMNPHTGEVKAWVGGTNFKFFQYDHVNVNSNRQVGSTFKPFVYALAIDNDLSPCYVAPTGPVSFKVAGGTWSPKNSAPVRSSHLNLYQALKLSVNTVTAHLMKKLGDRSPYSVMRLVSKMGVDSSKFKPYPSICLGAMDLSVIEMVGAYSTFANEGEFVEPIFITRIEDKYGNVIEEFVPKRVEAMRKQTAYALCKMMENTTQAGGTAAKMRSAYGISPDIPIAGKTGTTQNNSDGWFIGITPDLVSGCWVGAEDRQVHFRSTAYGQGGHMAMPIFAYYMKQIYDDNTIVISKSEFKKPDIEMTIELDCNKYEGYGYDPNAVEEVAPGEDEGIDN